ncbi:N-acetylmannosamine-6-phosphate 2-epimerase [Propionibacterium sp. NM47_B9-13]|jgi:N-acylglucosamine-6-phosphate 2-epimerase|uniref:Putative N-acetylmannosamine-6-phosphate 2-epimerase n=2 Tax=Cutibacterium modestum TaxID=2559073 RepID=A0AAD1KR99_9ACTN|nr:N-acetylmannosamine-6-phosphate 2-epimerase [Cutibacterium modestum]TGY30056.1 N-acetylmannosamine-6-phosphate 2-epimerase [Propionibacterium sp. NM47_B9-13]AOH45928.1 N-acetylmannosamine-6-phosphate 2-epimerase [Cutibacterium modestum]EGG26140.1 putative N-acetylmannosamine-6-phosphate epimerase [Cutibacterium modestum P08]MCP2376924.1 N-acetylmannosamine-6-phosphate 2-epimerase [Cutibacterium modestum 28N]MCP2377752.1 N-acetylmannosamine-6-phosphate 2-epimerase [Cutibacterium modestum 31N
MSGFTDRLIASMAGGLVVSCQAYPGEPLRHPETMAQMAAAVEVGGAVAVRAQGLSDVSAVRGRVSVPVVGIWKEGNEGIYITPTLRHARCVAAAGADIVALDGTRRDRVDGLTLAETIRGLKEEYDVVVMADCGSVDDGLFAAEAGADLIGTTLCGYTGERPKTDGPDYEVIETLVNRLDGGRPVIAEGRIHAPDQARRAMDLGAHAVVVGTAITHPTSITRWFCDALR